MRKYIIFLLILLLVWPLEVCLAADKDTVITNIFKRQADSIVVVGVIGKRKKGDRAGSGFFISEDGLILTNYHLIKKARRLFVKLRNDTVYTRVKVVNVDVPRDIAVLKIDDKGVGQGPARPVKLGDSDKVAIGQRVVAIGNPLGLENTVSDGLISAIRPAEQGIKLLQVSVPLSNGSSGGPLFNLQGEVIGVVAASLQQGQSLNFAIPINEVKPRLARLMDVDMPVLPKPVEVVPMVKKPPYRVYIVQSNDTLWGLAQRFDTTVDAIMKLNNTTSSKIIDGEKLKIPN